MEMYLVTASHYDYALIDSAWLTREGAEERIAYAQTLTSEDESYVPYAHSFKINKVVAGVVRGETERYYL